MHLPNPTPEWLTLLAPFLIGIVWSGQWLASQTSNNPITKRVLGPGIGVAGWIYLMHVVGYLSQSFLTGLTVATMLLGTGGFWMRWKHHREEPSSKSHQWWAIVIVSVLVTLIIAPMAINWTFHDETPLVGHLSMTAQIQHNIYPPRFISFPAYELRYHYGFALVCAAFTSLFKLSIPLAIDAVTLTAWFYSFLVLWQLGNVLLGNRRGWLTAFLTLLGGGISYGCAADGAPLAHDILGLCMVDGTMLNPPVISYFFQHPWTLGIPLAGITLLVLKEAMDSPGRAHYWVLGLLLLALSLCQIVLFAALAPTIIATLTLSEGKLNLGRGSRALALVIIVLLIASQMGGLFAPRADSAVSEFAITGGVANSLAGTLTWHGRTFGFLLPLALAGLMILRSFRLPLLLLMLGSLAVINVLEYTVSWDIIKFAVVTSLAMGILSSVCLNYLMEKKRELVFVVALSLCMGGGLVFPALFAIDHPSIPTSIFPRTPDPLLTQDIQTMTWLRTHMQPRESIIVHPQLSRGYAQRSGLGQAWTDGTSQYFGASQQRIEQRQQLLSQLPANPERYRAQGIRWLVVHPMYPALGALADTLIEHKLAVQRTVFNEVKVVEILDVP